MAVETTDELPETETDTISDSPNKEQPPRLTNLPKDFANRVATKIVITNERELDDAVAAKKVAALVYRNLNAEELQTKFVSVIEILLGDEETSKYAALTLIALLWYADVHPEYKEMVDNLVEHVFIGHITQEKSPWESDDSSATLSYYAFLMGEVFIQMVGLDGDFYDYLNIIFEMIIVKEMDFHLAMKESKDGLEKATTGKRKKAKTNVATTKKLYDDIVSYISLRGEFRSDTLKQKNPNEHIAILADRIRSTRHYIIQNVMNRQALDKKKKFERELREREASAEEIIRIEKPFNRGFYLYWVEKRYNFEYLAVERIRITLGVIGMVAGVAMIGLGILNIGTITILEGGIICLMMIAFSRFICSRRFFAPFYPEDVSKKLEQNVGIFTPVFRKMSQEQIIAFMKKQIKSPGNRYLLHLMVEYVKYIFTVIPQKDGLLMNHEEVRKFIEQLKVNIVRFQKTR